MEQDKLDLENTKPKPKVIFTPKALPWVLECLGLGIDDEGYVIDENKERVYQNQKHVKASEIKGMHKTLGFIL